MCKHGEARPGKVRVLLQRGPTTVTIKDVPGDACENCGEYCLSDAVTDTVLTVAEEAIRRDTEVEIVRYGASLRHAQAEPSPR